MRNSPPHLKWSSCVNALLSTLTHQAQGCCEQQHHCWVCRVTHKALTTLQHFPASGALHHPQALTAPLQCKYTDRLSKVQRFGARKWLLSVQNQGIAFQFEHIWGAEIFVNLRRLSLGSYNSKRSTVAGSY